MNHELFKNNYPYVLVEIGSTPQAGREKKIIELLEKFKPPKISEAQKRKYNAQSFYRRKKLDKKQTSVKASIDNERAAHRKAT
jgi:Mor family transcriptional regulator